MGRNLNYFCPRVFPRVIVLYVYFGCHVSCHGAKCLRRFLSEIFVFFDYTHVGLDLDRKLLFHYGRSRFLSAQASRGRSRKL